MTLITDEMRHRVRVDLSLEYENFLAQIDNVLLPAQIVDFADAKLSYEWIDKYDLQCEKACSVLSIVVNGYTYLWDEKYERVVAVYGISPNINKKLPLREKSRIAYYFRNFIKRLQHESALDTGHFIAHSLGGGLDMNLFPQNRAVNQGRSAEGSLYRKMERCAAKNAGTFVFSRPIYFDDTWNPLFLEYGVIKTDGSLWTHIFDNA